MPRLGVGTEPWRLLLPSIRPEPMVPALAVGVAAVFGEDAVDVESLR